MFSSCLDRAFFFLTLLKIRQGSPMEKIPDEFSVSETIVFNPPQMMYVWFDGSPDKKYLEKVCVYDPRILGYPVITLSGMRYSHCSFSKDSQGISNNGISLWLKCQEIIQGITPTCCLNFYSKLWRRLFGEGLPPLAWGIYLWLMIFTGSLLMSIAVSGTFCTFKGLQYLVSLFFVGL